MTSLTLEFYLTSRRLTHACTCKHFVSESEWLCISSNSDNPTESVKLVLQHVTYHLLTFS